MDTRVRSEEDEIGREKGGRGREAREELAGGEEDGDVVETLHGVAGVAAVAGHGRAGSEVRQQLAQRHAIPEKRVSGEGVLGLDCQRRGLGDGW